MADKAIQLYSWPTPNGQKIHIALEEFQLPFDAHGIDIGKGDQFGADFLEISPNNKIPAIIDPDGPGHRPIALFESGAILIYLAEKTGRLLPAAGSGRYQVLQWLMFQMGGVGPMFGQANHFRTFAPEKIPYAIDRYTNEVKRLLGVMDRRLGQSRFLALADYSIADIATWPWISYAERQGIELTPFPHVARWTREIADRPPVQRGLKILAKPQDEKPMSAAEREILFGKGQYQRR